jgi:hypothetical protein
VLSSIEMVNDDDDNDDDDYVQNLDELVGDWTVSNSPYLMRSASSQKRNAHARYPILLSSVSLLLL